MNRPLAHRCRILLLAWLVAAATLLVAVPAAHAAVWVTSPGVKVFPGTVPGSRKALNVSAAGGEYEGAIIGLKGGATRHASVSWAAGSDQLLIDASILDQVAFVYIKHPSSGTGARKGLYPDPLLPRRFGQTLTVPAKSSSLYVLFHVPYGTTGGAYAGTLHVVNGAEQVDLPVQLTVRDFGWQKLSVHTSFGVAFNDLGSNVTGAYRMLLEHGVCPQMPKLTAAPTSSGGVDRTKYASKLQTWLGADGLDMPLMRMPWLGWTPGYTWKFSAGSSRLLAYLTNICRVYKANGWQQRAIAYPIDEPHHTSDERHVEALARTLHKASARAGYHAPFLVTDDPRPTTLGPMLHANKFLWDDVDIWCVRFYYFFGRVPVLRTQQSHGKQVWWYPYCNDHIGTLPNFVIDKSLADSRVWGWLMYQWRVDGMLYWGVNRWRAARGGGTRDPYRDPLSFITSGGRHCNGEAMLVYPGYYPRYGLTNRNAPPVSSLRLEALRDGYEDLEYMKLAAQATSRATVLGIVKNVTTYPHPIKYGHIFAFPRYETGASAYTSARAALARLIQAAVAPPVTPPATPSAASAY